MRWVSVDGLGHGRRRDRSRWRERRRALEWCETALLGGDSVPQCLCFAGCYRPRATLCGCLCTHTPPIIAGCPPHRPSQMPLTACRTALSAHAQRTGPPSYASTHLTHGADSWHAKGPRTRLSTARPASPPERPPVPTLAPPPSPYGAEGGATSSGRQEPGTGDVGGQPTAHVAPLVCACTVGSCGPSEEGSHEYSLHCHTHLKVA